MFFQYQQGFIDEEYYRDSFRERVRRLAPVWQALNVGGARKSFADEIDTLMAETLSSQDNEQSGDDTT
jgi:hypothetical protein